MSQKIWVVYGETGEYSDHSEWTVAAYTSEADAKAHADAATKWYGENGGKELRRYLGTPAQANPHDPSMQIDYTGTEWNIYPVELHENFAPKDTP